VLTQTYRKHILFFILIGIITLLVASPILSRGDLSEKTNSGEVFQGNGNGNGNGNGGGNGGGNGNGNGNGGGNGNSNGGGGNNTQPEPVISQSAAESDTLLGCQRNNPERLDCSSLEVTGICEGNIAVFTIRNTGEPGNGDMRAPTQYRLVVDGVVVETGQIQLAGGATMTIQYAGGGSVTLEADQQTGHPGSSHPRTTLSCGTPSEVTPTDEPTVEPPNLAAGAYCAENGSAVFVITNDGGDMTEALPYVVSDAAGNVVAEGTILLLSGEGLPLAYSSELGATTLNIGGGLVIATIECQPVPTEEPTPPADPNLMLDAFCNQNGYATFIITNIGGDMAEAVHFVVTTDDGTIFDEGWLQLASGESMYLEYNSSAALTITVGDNLLVTRLECVVIPTEEPTPPTEPDLILDSYCTASGYPQFIVRNYGGDMIDPVYYLVTDGSGSFIEEGWLQLAAGESIMLEYFINGAVILTIGDGLLVSYLECQPVPTEEVTPSPEPTEEVTPSPEPTEEVTPTPEPTDPAPLGCQGNNPDRLDCSSLGVSGYCDGSVAVFTIRNTGEPGNGDMRAPTEYRLVQDGVVIESGSVQLLGGETMEIHYEGGGTITLEADQQVGHPGQSHPRATLNCAL
jgi:hypothetical protein